MQLKLASAQTKSPTSKPSTKQSGLAWPPNTKPTLLRLRLGKKLSGKLAMPSTEMRSKKTKASNMKKDLTNMDNEE